MAWYHATNWADVEPNLYHHMAWLDYNNVSAEFYLSLISNNIHNSWQLGYQEGDLF